MPEHMSEDMPGRMPEDMPDRMPEDMPDRMPEGMPDSMPDKMSDRMPEDLPVTKCINVMVGITRSNFWVHFRLSLEFPGQQGSASSVVQTGASHVPADEFPHQWSVCYTK